MNLLYFHELWVKDLTFFSLRIDEVKLLSRVQLFATPRTVAY